MDTTPDPDTPRDHGPRRRRAGVDVPAVEQGPGPLLDTAHDPSDAQCGQLAARDNTVVDGPVGAVHVVDDRLVSLRLARGAWWTPTPWSP